MNYSFSGISRELLSKGSHDKSLFSWILLASFLASLLGLASSLYAIQIFNRYIGYGLDGTLLTLTTGALLAIALEFVLKSVRYRLTSSLLMPREATEFDSLAKTINRLSFGVLASQPGNYTFEHIKAQQQLHNLYTPANFLTIVDSPFALVFLVFITLLSPLVGVLVATVCLLCLVLSGWHKHRIRSLLESSNAAQAELDTNLVNSIHFETIRAFNFASVLEPVFQQRLRAFIKARAELAAEQQQQNSHTAVITALTTVMVVGLGAVLVTRGQMDIGSLIGVNILAARAINLVSGVGRLSQSFEVAQTLEQKLSAISGQEQSRDRGLLLPRYSGGIQLKGLTHGYDPRLGPLFSDLTVDLKPGKVLVICGNNGAGKSTLARIIAGLIDPEQGQVLVDGIDLLQVEPGEWHRQLSYVPQEPEFVDLSLRDNLISVNPDLDDDKIREILRQCACGELVDHHPDGLDQFIQNGGQNYPPGVRKRLALARAVAADGKLVILDEIHNGLDQSGLAALMNVLQDMITAGKTIVLCSHDRSVIKTGAMVLDLNIKPTPRLEEV